MRSLTVAMWLCLGVASAAQAGHPPPPPPPPHHHIGAAPAPEIGASIPAVLVIGGVLLGATLVKRWRPS